MISAGGHEHELQFTPETIISDRSDARLLVFGGLMSWVALVPYSVGLILGWPALVIAAGAVAFVGVIRTLVVAGRVASRLRPRNKGTILASSFDEFNASLNLMRPSVIKRALLLFRERRSAADRLASRSANRSVRRSVGGTLAVTLSEACATVVK